MDITRMEGGPSYSAAIRRIRDFLYRRLGYGLNLTDQEVHDLICNEWTMLQASAHAIHNEDMRRKRYAEHPPVVVRTNNWHYVTAEWSDEHQCYVFPGQ